MRGLRHRQVRRHTARRKREGAALLIVLFVLMMATGTAMFAVQSTQFEQRAAGSLHQAVRTRFIAESATVGVLSLCSQLGITGCTDIKRAQNTVEESNDRLRYALPSAGTRETVYRLTQADMVGGGFTGESPIASDSVIAGGGAAMPYTPSFVSIMERWELPRQDESRQRYRVIVSTYGQLGLADDTKADDELRYGHDSISATRAFFDVR